MTTQKERLLKELTGEKSLRAIALKSDMTPSTLTRQVEEIKIETVIQVARAYNLPVIKTLARFGFLQQRDIKEAVKEISLGDYSDVELAEEIVRRVKRGNATLTKPIDQVVDVNGDPAEVHELPVSQVSDINIDDIEHIENLPHAAYPDTDEPEDHTP